MDGLEGAMAWTEGWGLALPVDEEDEAQPAAERAGADRAGSEVASLVEMYGRLLFRVAFSVVRSPAEAEEVVQDVFLRVLERRGRLAEVREMRVWLVRIAWNLAIDRRRRVRPAQMDAAFVDGLMARGVSAEQAVGERERMEAVLREMDRLPRREREVLVLAAIEELGAAEMAAVLGRSESAVRALLFRARARLRERLDEKGGVR